MANPAEKTLTLDPWNMNRYAFAGGNPISFVELDGHIYEIGGGFTAPSSTGRVSDPEELEKYEARQEEHEHGSR